LQVQGETYIATRDILCGIFAHLLLEQLVCRVLSYHGRHDGCVAVRGVLVNILDIAAEAKVKAC
jgi:hypothetical protein